MKEFTARQCMEKIKELEDLNQKLYEIVDKRKRIEAEVRSLEGQGKALQDKEQVIKWFFESQLSVLSVFFDDLSTDAKTNINLTCAVLDCLKFRNLGGHLNSEAYQQLSARAATESEQKDISESLAAIPVEPSASKKFRRI